MRSHPSLGPDPMATFTWLNLRALIQGFEFQISIQKEGRVDCFITS